jgi:two-component system sensor histidine kinase NreB
VEDAEDALRATVARTRPPALRDGDLAVAVGQLRDDLEMRYGLRVTLEWPVVEYPLPLATAVTIYRFFQEALLNVLKHADVDDAVASLTVDGRQLMAVVRDSGPGFDMSTQPVAGAGGRHVGLGLLRERARLAGGSVEVISAPGAGTMLTLRLPLPAAPAGWAGQPVSSTPPVETMGPSGALVHPAGQ